MALNRDKFRKIVVGLTTPAEPELRESPVEPERPGPEIATPKEQPQPAERGRGDAESTADDARRFARRGRPKASKETPRGDKTRKVKVSLFLPEGLVNDLYSWAYDDKIQPGEMFERGLKPFHEREAKRRNAGRE